MHPGNGVQLRQRRSLPFPEANFDATRNGVQLQPRMERNLLSDPSMFPENGANYNAVISPILYSRLDAPRERGPATTTSYRRSLFFDELSKRVQLK